MYDSENAHETFEYELERALESECSLIVIEPSKLGDETSRWIAVGNCLHKTAALSGLAAIVTGLSHLYVKVSLKHVIICYINLNKLQYERNEMPLHRGSKLYHVNNISILQYFSGVVWGDRPYICGPLGFTSVITCGLYTVSWQFDPCCQYQVETDTSKLPHVELLAVLGPSSPTFLVRKDDRRRRILHTTITLAALGITAWRVYQAFK